MRKTLSSLLLIACLFAGALAQFDPPVEDCIAEHRLESRAVLQIVEAGCVLDYTEYTARGNYWTAYGHIDVVSEFVK